MKGNKGRCVATHFGWNAGGLDSITPNESSFCFLGQLAKGWKRMKMVSHGFVLGSRSSESELHKCWLQWSHPTHYCKIRITELPKLPPRSCESSWCFIIFTSIPLLPPPAGMIPGKTPLQVGDRPFQAHSAEMCSSPLISTECARSHQLSNWPNTIILPNYDVLIHPHLHKNHYLSVSWLHTSYYFQLCLRMNSWGFHGSVPHKDWSQATC